MEIADTLRRVLAEVALEGRTISYRDLAARARVPPPHRIHKVTLALEAMVRADAAAGRPLIAALAVSRGAEAIPGRGFFDLCRDLGLYDGPDRGPAAAAFHADLLREVLDVVEPGRTAGPEGVLQD